VKGLLKKKKSVKRTPISMPRKIERNLGNLRTRETKVSFHFRALE
jgi:hypothetical protein